MKTLSAPRLRAGIVSLAAVFALLGSASAAPTTFAASAAPVVAPAATIVVRSDGAPVNSIIMRDGGVCDPIRHMGC
jgi:hypothetical protein